MPPVEVFPTEDLIDCAEAALRRDGPVLLQYGRSPGYGPLREWLGQQCGVGPEQVLIGNSSLEIFSFLTQVLLQPGARAFVEVPSYDRTIGLLRRAGVQVTGIPLQDDGIDLDALEDELRRGAPALMYVIPDFQNPMGTTMSLEKRKRVAALAEQHGFWILEDGPYRDLRYTGDEVPTIRSLAPDRVLYLSSFSKLLAPGLRLGHMVGSAQVISRVAEWATNTYIGPVFPTQGIVYEYCRRGLLQPNIERLKEVYRPRLEAVLAALETHRVLAEWSRPQGGYYVSGMLPEDNDIVTLQERAEAVGLKLTDGRGFFPNPADGMRFLRIPFCSLSPQECREAIQRLAEIVV